MDDRRLRLMAAVAAIAMSGALTGSEAFAHTQKDGANIDLSWDGNGFSGKIFSGESKCVAKRKIRLFRRGEQGAVFSATSDQDGEWSVTTPRENGNYLAKVAKRTLKKNDKHKHVCKFTKSTPAEDAKVRDCDEVTLYNGTGGATPQTIGVDDDLTVYVAGEPVFIDSDGFAQELDPIELGPVSFGEDIRIVGTNGFQGGPIGIDPISAECSTVFGGSGSAVLDAVGVPPGADQEPGFVFYDETYPLPEISLTR